MDERERGEPRQQVKQNVRTQLDVHAFSKMRAPEFAISGLAGDDTVNEDPTAAGDTIALKGIA